MDRHRTPRVLNGLHDGNNGEYERGGTEGLPYLHHPIPHAHGPRGRRRATAPGEKNFPLEPWGGIWIAKVPPVDRHRTPRVLNGLHDGNNGEYERGGTEGLPYLHHPIPHAHGPRGRRRATAPGEKNFPLDSAARWLCCERRTGGCPAGARGKEEERWSIRNPSKRHADTRGPRSP